MPPEFSKSQVDRAGKQISHRLPWPDTEGAWDDFIKEALARIRYWRGLHALPLDFVKKRLAARALSVDPQAVVVQRLKRFPSIRQKLRTSPTMSLTTMQDIAGCRAIVQSVDQVYAVKRLYEDHVRSSPGSGPELINKWTKDYIIEPKPDGYRSIHLVVKFRSARPRLEHLNGLRVELQIRSRMQHAWAMAVETASSVTDQALKAGSGEPQWKRFFELMGDVIAALEGGALLCGNFSIDKSTRTEAASLAATLKVIPLLEGMSGMLEHFKGNESSRYDLYLLVSDSGKRELYFWGFSNSQFEEANSFYTSKEHQYRDDSNIHVVLVSANSLEDLRLAYPSYFMDSTIFIGLVSQVFQGSV